MITPRPSYFAGSKGITKSSAKKERNIPCRGGGHYRSGLSRPTLFLSVKTLRRTSYDVSLCSLSSGLLLGLLMAASTMAGGRNSKPHICFNIGHGRIRSDAAELNSHRTIMQSNVRPGPFLSPFRSMRFSAKDLRAPGSVWQRWCARPRPGRSSRAGANIAGDGKLQCACSSVQETRGPVWSV